MFDTKYYATREHWGGETAMCVVNDVVALIDRTLSDVRGLAVSNLDDAQVLTLTAALDNLHERSAALLGDALHAGQERLIATRAGHRTMEGVLAAEGGQNSKRLQPIRRDAAWLVDFPTFADAYRTGQLHRSHIHDLRSAHNGRLHHALVDAQQMLVGFANTLTFPEFRQALARWVLTVDPDGAEPVDDERGQTMPYRYGINIKKRTNGDVEIRGLLPPIEGEAFETAVETATKKLWDAHDSNCNKDRLPWRQLRMHGLMALITRGYTRSNPSQQAPLINVVLSHDRLEQLIREMSDQADHETCCGADPPNPITNPFDRHDFDNRCETIAGTPLRQHHLTPLLAAAAMRRHVFGAKLEDATVSKAQRLFPQWMANALKIWGRGLCATPGCPATIHWLHTDHIEPFSHGGETLLPNGRSYCSADNQWRGNNAKRGVYLIGAAPH